MQEWDPQYNTNVVQLCEVSLALIHEKTAAERLYIWLKAPEPQLYRFQVTQGLVSLDLAHLKRLMLPHQLIDQAMYRGHPMIEQIQLPSAPDDYVEAAQQRLRVCFPLKQHGALEGVIYLETHRRIDRLSPHQRQSIQHIIHYLSTELSTHLLPCLIHQDSPQRLCPQNNLEQSQTQQNSCLDMLQALHSVSIALSRSHNENQLLRNAVLLARNELQLDRVAIFLIEPDGKNIRGTWGTNEEGDLVDEHHFISPIPDHPMVQEALRRKDYVLVMEDTPLYYEMQPVGHGWNAMVSLWDDTAPIGWIAADNQLWQQPLQTYHCEIFKQYATILSQLLIRQRTQQQLEDLNYQLETRIAERTIHLTETNQALAAANQRLSLLSQEDALTGIANRRLWDITIQREWGWARRTQNVLAVLMIDVDEFKAYNDHFGHIKGDECLQQVARVLREAERRSTNLVARYGGEEFAILLCAPQPGEAALLAQRIHDGFTQLKLPHPRSRVADYITVSIGFSYLVPSQDGIWQSLIAQADQALYRAKSQGRARTLAYR